MSGWRWYRIAVPTRAFSSAARSGPAVGDLRPAPIVRLRARSPPRQTQAAKPGPCRIVSHRAIPAQRRQWASGGNR